MSGRSVTASFAADRYALDERLALSLMSAGEAEAAGRLCAGIEPWLSYPFSADELVRFFASEEVNAPRFAVTLGSEFAGALVVRRDWFRGPYVHMLVVTPALQGQGLGGALLAFVEQQARNGRERNLWIAATETNVGARRLYERCGFAAVAHLDGLVRDGVTEVLMRKRLSEPVANSQ